MAKFLNTSATNFYLEELIKQAKERVILISPFLKVNDRIRELLEDKNRLKIDVRLIYGKSELLPEMTEWLKNQDYIRTSYCKNLHAKCYVNEYTCIISSLNLYEFSQINNNEMGVLIRKDEDPELFRDTYEEVQRLIRISDEVRIHIEKTTSTTETDNITGSVRPNKKEEQFEKLTSSHVAKQLGLKSAAELHEILVAQGWMEKQDDHYLLTEHAKAQEVEAKRGQYGVYFLWPKPLIADLATFISTETKSEA